MHGEYKVQGGKLVVVDFDTRDERLSNVQVSGDFFLEPAEALADISGALEGLPITVKVEDITLAIRSKLRPGAEMIGFSPEAVAIAVRRALGVTGTWRDYEWQIIEAPPQRPAMHLALDEVLAREVAAGRRGPCLRFWEWERPAIIIGGFQSLRNEVDLEAANRFGVETVRRVTGGGAMFVEPGSAVTYSLYAPAELVRDMSFADSYAFLDDWVLKALNELGIDAFYKPLNDISSSKGKIGGAAQKRFSSGAVLHHVTMSYDMDAQKMVQVLRIGREKLSDKGTTSAVKRVDPLRSQTGLPREEIIRRMKETFASLNGGTAGSISPEEYAAAEKLAAEKFSTEEWLRHVP
ncbi:lipoate--protein ligase family protein [Rhizobiales bacterium RZME27]|jgi:lipoate-protein ligase A|uniref:Lipoate--protein ligase family protein n=1 Tax=Endobacterium cereale TaxID=2663029 RepID=A0A6A8AF78_9HYPH|nr:biotin/lipoate A/B protein ligase family protein [Endobacterium cereale]MEB2844165.1 biotin/lipoate A/B protein ligase family protein [Endobacterium cereale]MQY48578.1 lipoate--protein ligase family protein [Endobacterium cereale]